MSPAPMGAHPDHAAPCIPSIPGNGVHPPPGYPAPSGDMLGGVGGGHGWGRVGAIRQRPGGRHPWPPLAQGKQKPGQTLGVHPKRGAGPPPAPQGETLGGDTVIPGGFRVGSSTLGGGEGVCLPPGVTGVEAGGGGLRLSVSWQGATHSWGNPGVTRGTVLGMLLCPPPGPFALRASVSPVNEDKAEQGLAWPGATEASGCSTRSPAPRWGGRGGFAGAGGRGSPTLPGPGTHPGPHSLPASGLPAGSGGLVWAANSFLIREAGRDGEQLWGDGELLQGDGERLWGDGELLGGMETCSGGMESSTTPFHGPQALSAPGEEGGGQLCPLPWCCSSGGFETPCKAGGAGPCPPGAIQRGMASQALHPGGSRAPCGDSGGVWMSSCGSAGTDGWTAGHIYPGMDGWVGPQR